MAISSKTACTRPTKRNLPTNPILCYTFPMFEMFETKKKKQISEPVSIIAHQLKSPLSIIKGYLEAMLSETVGDINDKQKEYLMDALENVRRMATSIGHIQDVMRIEQEKFSIKLQPIDLTTITNEVVDDLKLWAHVWRTAITFTTVHMPLVWGNAVQIREVIENFISNAVKYSTKKEGEVRIELHEIDCEILFSCRDEGVGIPQSEFDKVFSKFYRSEAAFHIDPTGTGLGLYINKAVVEQSGGRIWFEKNENQGMTFYFTLPIVDKSAIAVHKKTHAK
jgi:signal transduction histidine kinase